MKEILQVKLFRSEQEAITASTNWRVRIDSPYISPYVASPGVWVVLEIDDDEVCIGALCTDGKEDWWGTESKKFK